LAVRGGDGLAVGTTSGAMVKATVAEHFLGDKIKVFTYKAKKTFKKTKGHRSRLTRLSIDAIEPAAKKEKKSGS
jgi:large subunit ribosomal protein L21